MILVSSFLLYEWLARDRHGLQVLQVSGAELGRPAVEPRGFVSRAVWAGGTDAVHECDVSVGPTAFALNHAVPYPAGTVSSSRRLRVLPVSHLLLPLALISVCSLCKEEAFWLFLMLPSSRHLYFLHPSSVLLAQQERPELILPVSPAREAAPSRSLSWCPPFLFSLSSHPLPASALLLGMKGATFLYW